MTLARSKGPGAKPPPVVLTYNAPVTPEAAQTLAVLRQAVAEALDRKRRLGQYAIVWRDGQVVQVEPQDLPALP